MKIVVAPDKFKGSLPATQVAAAIAAGLHARPGAEVVRSRWPTAARGRSTRPGGGQDPVGVARAAARHGIGVVAVAGRSTLMEAELAAAGIAAVYSLSDLEPDLERCRAEAARLLRRTGQMIARDRLAGVAAGA